MNFEPLHDRVVVKKDEAEKVSEGGIYFAPNALEKPVQGTVMAVGPGKYAPNGTFIPTVLKEGDVVIFGKTAGYPVKLGNQEYTMLVEEEIYGTIT